MSSVAFWEIVSRLAVSGAVIGFLAACKRFIMIPKADFDTAGSTDVRVAAVIAVNACMIIVGVILALTIHSILIAANHYMATQAHDIQMVLYPSTAIWWFLPGFSALCLAWEITLRLWSLFDRRGANGYRAFSNVRSGFDATKVLRWMALIVVAPIAILSALAVPIHTTLTATAIHDGHFAHVHEVVLPYSSAKDLTRFDGYLNRDGSFHARAGIIVRFKDGNTWNSADTDDPRMKVNPALVELLTERTGLPIGYSQKQPRG